MISLIQGVFFPQASELSEKKLEIVFNRLGKMLNKVTYLERKCNFHTWQQRPCNFDFFVRVSLGKSRPHVVLLQDEIGRYNFGGNEICTRLKSTEKLLAPFSSEQSTLLILRLWKYLYAL